MKKAIIPIFIFYCLSGLSQDINLVHDGWPVSSCAGLIELSTGEIVHYGYKDTLTRIVLSHRTGGPIWRGYPKDSAMLRNEQIIHVREQGDSLDVIYGDGEIFRGSKTTGEFVLIKRIIESSKIRLQVTSEDEQTIVISGKRDTNSIIYILNKSYEKQDSFVQNGNVIQLEHSKNEIYTLSWDERGMVISKYKDKGLEYKFVANPTVQLINDIELVNDQLLICGEKEERAYIGKLNTAGKEVEYVYYNDSGTYEAFLRVVQLDNGVIGAVHKRQTSGLGHSDVTLLKFDVFGKKTWSTKFDISDSNTHAHTLIKSRQGSMIMGGETGQLDVGKSNWAYVVETTGLSSMTTRPNSFMSPKIKINPNPTTGQFKIEGVGARIQCKLLGMEGRNQVLKRGNEFDIGHLNDGIYFIRINDRAKETTLSIIKH